MAKRISVKGRGLGAYFPNDDTASMSLPEQSAPVPAPSPDLMVEEKGAVASRDSLPTRPNRSSRPSEQKRPGSLFDAVSARTAELPYINAAFRFSRRELNALEERVHEIKRKHGAKITKQDLIRIGLAGLLEEHERNGDQSLLGQYIKNTKHIAS